jgi:hypothetical protein
MDPLQNLDDYLFDNNQKSEEQSQVIQATRVPKTKQAQQQNNAQTAQAINSLPLQQTDGSTEQNLSILMNTKDFYTENEWNQRYQIYSSECGKIKVDPTNLTSSSIAIAAGRIDALLTPVRLDNASIQAKQVIYEMQLKVAKETAFKSVYEGFIARKEKMPPIDDRKALTTEEVRNLKMPEDNLNLFELNQRYAKRALQVESIVKILQDKKDLLITFSATLKLENTVNGFTPNVPTDNQLRQMKG